MILNFVFWASIDKMLAEIHSLQDRLRSQTDQKEELEEALKRAISEKSESEIQITADYERLQSQVTWLQNALYFLDSSWDKWARKHPKEIWRFTSGSLKFEAESY